MKIILRIFGVSGGGDETFLERETGGGERERERERVGGGLKIEREKKMQEHE